MRRAPIATLLGPALVLYLVADAAAAQGELDPVGLLVALVAAALSLSRLAVGRDADLPGARAVAWLGLGLGLSLVRVAAPHALSLPLDVVVALALCGSALLIVELATAVPDVVLGIGRRVRRVLRGLSVVLAAVAVATHAPVVHAAGVDWLLPARWALVPWAYLSVALVLALSLRMSRRRMGSSAEALASNTWALFGLLPATAAAIAGWVLAALGWGLDSAALRIGFAFGAAALFWGHLRLTDPSRRVGVGPATRDAVAATATLVTAAVAGVVLRPLWPAQPLPLMLAVTASLLSLVGLYRVLRELTRVTMAPFAGRLLSAIEQGHRELAMTRNVEELAEHALGCLRRASGSADSEPLLYVLTPELSLRIDAAGRAHRDAGPLHPEVLRALTSRPGEIMVSAPLAAQVVRNPPLRPLIDALAQLDALCVVPLVVDGELEGALVLPTGRRRSTPNLEELEALHGFGRHVAGYTSVLSRELRATARVGELLHAKQRAEAEVARLDAALSRSAAEGRALRAGGSLELLESPEMVYSPAMRTLCDRMVSAATQRAPLLLVAERGVEVLPLCRLLHRQGGDAERPFVLGACAQVQPDDAEAALFGDGAERLGWLQVAAGGVLVLSELPALGARAQARLAEALTAGEVDARVVATSRLEPDALEERGALSAELREHFGLVLRVPPLRERVEDLPSLTLPAIDRACRVLGRDTVGIAPEAQARLDEHGWPGNQQELDAVIEQAVARCQGVRIGLGELPELGAPPVRRGRGGAGHPLEGSLEAIEGRVLAYALERTDGNRSEAARLLGLKRTTFLDKLRRHGLEKKKSTRARARMN